MLMLTKTKLDFSFPDDKFYMKPYSKSYKLHRSNKGGASMIW